MDKNPNIHYFRHKFINFLGLDLMMEIKIDVSKDIPVVSANRRFTQEEMLIFGQEYMLWVYEIEKELNNILTPIQFENLAKTGINMLKKNN